MYTLDRAKQPSALLMQSGPHLLLSQPKDIVKEAFCELWQDLLVESMHADGSAAGLKICSIATSQRSGNMQSDH